MSQRDSRSACGTPLAAPAIAIRAANSSSSSDEVEEGPPVELLEAAPERVAEGAVRPVGDDVASWSVTTMKLGIVSATVLAKSHWRCSSTSRRLRSVMSIPPAMIRTTFAVLVHERRGAPGDHALLAPARP